MNLFVNPDVAYLLLISGFILAFLALATPGTHFLEAGALLLLFAAGYEITQLGVTIWALVVLVVGLVPFIYAIRGARRGWALAVSIVCLIVGSLYLFPSQNFIPAVNPVLAVVMSAASGVFLWFAVRMVIQAHRTRPLQDPEHLVGLSGEAKTEVLAGGSVQVASELWSARSEKPIPAGSRIRVLRREGFTLVVEQADQVTH
ncbi:MAG TPA: NfeD family protein [Anaerolineales bacterium]|nr:NfeD family protein [Anaerolineales bacterium]